MDNARIDRIIDKHQGEARALIQILLDIQSQNHWLPAEALERVSEKLGVPLSKVQHTATFYKAFSLVPEGQHKIHICNGTSCHVRGSQRVIDTVQYLIGIRPGETGSDLKFSLKTCTCMGSCTSGPVMVVDGQHHDKMSLARVEDVLENCD
jgi:NADH-quinone oxidoreductase subunit E